MIKKLRTQATNSYVGYGLALFGLISFVSVLAFFWLSRGDWVYPEQLESSLQLEMPPGDETSLGQTFVARQAGLQGIGVKPVISPTQPAQQLRLKLFSEPGATEALRQATASTAGLVNGAYLYFRFAPLTNSKDAYYYFTLETDSIASDYPVTLYAAPLTNYINGSAYSGAMPKDAQLAFHLNYNRRYMLQNLIQRVVTSLPVALVIIAFLMLPGAVLLVWLPLTFKLDIFEWLAVSIGLSLSLYPLTMLWLRYAPIFVSSLMVWALFGGLLLLLLLGIWRNRKQWATFKASNLNSITPPAFVALVVVLILSWIVRIDIIQGIDVPLWADSYHHTMLSQLIVDNGKLPANWAPYASMQSLNYHYGFHTMVAVLHWLTGLPVIKSVLLFGQILNWLAVLMAYLLGRRLGGNAWIGLCAALITGLISQYPMFYVNWGRYTQLTGQILLPPLIVLTWLLLKDKKRNKTLLILSILLTVGLTLTHFRVIAFYPAFMLPLVILRWYDKNWQRPLIIEDIIRLFLIAVGAFIIVCPRLFELVGSKMWKAKLEIPRQGINNEFVRQVYNTLLNIFDYVSPVIVLLSGLGLILGSWRRKVPIAAFGLTWLILLIIANPHFLGFPGTDLINNFAIYIAAYLIFSLLAGFVLGEVIEALTKKRQYLGWIILPIIIAISLLGAREQMKLLNPGGILVTRPDLLAMTWIKENIPENAVFMVNNRLTYGDRAVTGTDGGWWLPFLTGRQNNTPPLNAGLESRIFADNQPTPREIYQNTQALNLSAIEYAHKMQAYGIGYIYIGQQRGNVWRDDDIPLDVKLFAQSPAFDLIYAQDGVRIFKLNTEGLEAK